MILRRLGASCRCQACRSPRSAIAYLGAIALIAACSDTSKNDPPGGGALVPSGCALSIPAEGAQATVDHTDALFLDSFTVELWARFDQIPPFQLDAAIPPPQRILAAENVAQDTGFYIEVDLTNVTSRLQCTIRRGDGQWTVGYGSSDLSGGWRHIACSLSDVGLSMWFMGTGIDTVPMPSNFTPPGYTHDGSPMTLGAAAARSPHVRATSGFTGAIDEVRFSSGAVYNATVDPDSGIPHEAAFVPYTSAPLSSSTTALWHFDECAGTTAGDSSPGGRAAALEGGALWLAAGGDR